MCWVMTWRFWWLGSGGSDGLSSNSGGKTAVRGVSCAVLSHDM